MAVVFFVFNPYHLFSYVLPSRNHQLGMLFVCGFVKFRGLLELCVLHGIAWSCTFVRVENLTFILCTLFCLGAGALWLFFGGNDVDFIRK